MNFNFYLRDLWQSYNLEKPSIAGQVFAKSGAQGMQLVLSLGRMAKNIITKLFTAVKNRQFFKFYNYEARYHKNGRCHKKMYFYSKSSTMGVKYIKP